MARKNENNWVRIFEVTNPTRHKKGFTVYKVTSKVFPTTFPEGVTTLTVWKRYNDFKKLCKELQKIHSNLHLGGDFPKFPKAKAFGMGRFDYDIVDERRKSALAVLDFAAIHSQLFTSKVFVQFFESGYHMKEVLKETQDKPDTGNGECLVPEKLWKEKDGSQIGTEDGLSISSIGSSSPDTATFTTDSDSMISSSILSATSDVPHLMHPSLSIDFGSLGLPSASTSTCTKSTADSVSSRSRKNKLRKGASLSQEPRSRLVSQNSLAEEDYVVVAAEIDRESQSNLSLVSNSKSCPSLDAISASGNGTVDVDQQQSTAGKRKNLKSSWSLSIRRKPNGFAGFFDFLPIFPKKAEENKVLGEKLFADSLTESYICEAAGHFAVAQQHESNGECEKALDSYKEGIKILLVGGQNDKDHKRRLIVKNKVEKYLTKAETLHSSLSSESSTTIPVLFSPKKIQNLLLPHISSSEASNIKSDTLKPSPIQDLRNYKVVGVAATGVVLVVNIEEKVLPKCYAVKVLQKSSSPLYPNRETLIPSQVPFMVKLVKWFDSDSTIILLMQYAGGGRLQDFVSTYQTKQIAIIPHDDPSPGNEIEIAPDTNPDTDYFRDEKGRSSASCSSPSGSDHSLSERKKAMSVLAALAEQVENNSRDLNGNLEKEELCESYARLFQESDSEDSPSQGHPPFTSKAILDCSNSKNSLMGIGTLKQGEVESNLESEKAKVEMRVHCGCGSGKKSKCEMGIECVGSGASVTGEKVGKLAVDSSSGNMDVNEALESVLDSPTSTKFPIPIQTRESDKRKGKRRQEPRGKTSASTSSSSTQSLFPPTVESQLENKSKSTTSAATAATISWSNLDTIDTGDLIESSKVLIQTVSRTLTQTQTPSECHYEDSGNSINGGDDGDGSYSKVNGSYKLSQNHSYHPDPESSSKEERNDGSSSNRRKRYGSKCKARSSMAKMSTSASTSGEGSIDSSVFPSASSTVSASAVGAKQKPIELRSNETGNNNNNRSSHSSQNEDGTELGLGLGFSLGGCNTIQMNDESESQFIKSEGNEKLSSTGMGRNGDGEDGGRALNGMDCCYSFKSETSTDDLLGKICEETTKIELKEDGDRNREGEPSTCSSESTAATAPLTCYYPQASHNPDGGPNDNLCCESLPIQRMVPECCIKVWTAEMVLALEKLHSLGLTYGDLGMRNILLGESGHILLSFTSQWAEVDCVPVRSEWVAPEARNVFENSLGKIHFSADWWSLGAILFYLLTGQTVESCHPEGFHANTILKALDNNLVGDKISNHAKSLMTELLQINPNLRLGYYGAEEIKSHPFFDGFDWESALQACNV